MVSLSNGPSPLSNSTLSPESFINVDMGDPVAFGTYWEKMSDECRVEIKGEEFVSYVGDSNNMCWYMIPQMKETILRLHNLVGNVVTKDSNLVLGNGSCQLFQTALYALSSSLASQNPVNVVAEAPYYSEYPEATNIVKSGLYKWGGDASVYDKDEPYIEVVTSPNNPDGTIRTPVVKSNAQGKVIYDLAYYWPQYTPITHPLNQDLILFTLSKCTGHAGSRIGWAFVKDIEVAKKMIRYIHLNSIGVSKESQVRATKLIDVICDGYQNSNSIGSDHLFFHFSKRLMKERWDKLRVAIDKSKVFTLTKYPIGYCNFNNELSENYPAFAWLKCVKGIQNCESYLQKMKIRTRGGEAFGCNAKYVRASMIGKDHEFIEFITRLSNAKRD